MNTLDRSRVLRAGVAGLALCALAAAIAVSAASAPTVPVPPPGITTRGPKLGVDTLDQRQTDALMRLRSGAAGDGLEARFVDGQPRLVSGRIPVTGEDAPSRSRAFLEGYGRDLWRLGPNSELRLSRVDPATGLAAYKQRYRGLPVVGGNINVLTDPQGVYAAIGSLMPGDGLDVTPTLGEHEVLQLVQKHGGSLLAPPQLAVSYARLRVVGAAGNVLRRTPRLVWIVPCIKDGYGHVMHYDAHSGEVLREVSLEMESAAANEDYTADWNDANQGATLLCQGAAVENIQIGDETSLHPNYLSRPDYVMGWTNARRAYVFFYDVFGRMSYDDSSSTIYGYHESPDTDNAHWVSWCHDIHWAAGYGAADTPVHELAHGVNDYTSELEYEDEPGALNESFSDIMAAIADNDGDRWLFGEGNVDSSVNPRNMRDPARRRYTDYVYDTDDHGGVHRNSGIGNRAAYLLAEGQAGTPFEYPVRGIGVQKAGKVLYVAFNSLTDDATYDDLRNTAMAVARYWAVYGQLHGFTLADECSVRNAFTAVEVDGVDVDRIPNEYPVGGDADCDGVADEQTTDADGDGVEDRYDNCELVANSAQTNTDGDSAGDACETDDDDDDVPDVDDNCPLVVNEGQQDDDGNGMGNACQDVDGDGKLDVWDNCPTIYNPDQKDSGGYAGVGDACDGDSDGDGVFNSDPDNCPLVANTDQADTDGDFFGDACDGCPNQTDIPAAFGYDGRPLQPDSDGDGTPDACDGSLKVEGPSTGKVAQGRTPQPGTFAFNGGSRITLPLSLCPEPCVEEASAPLVGSAFALDLEGLMAGVTAMVTDQNGKAWARTRSLSDGSRRLFFSPRGDRRYFLTLQRGAGAPDSGQFNVRSFLRSPSLVSPADVAVSASDAPDPVASGQDLRYTVQVANEAFSRAEGVALRLTLPSGSSLKSAPGGCTASGSELQCEVGELDAGVRVKREIVVAANGCPATPLAFTARVESGTVDPVSDNDSVSLKTKVADASGPVLSSLTAQPAVLSPPNHKLRSVDLKYAVSDACDAAPNCRITGVTANETINGPGDGATVMDWQIVDADTVRLRAERSGESIGREYYVAFECTDSAGNTTRKSVTVHVPLEK